MADSLSRLDATNIQSRIFTIRGLQVMVDRDLAKFYQVETRVLNQAVKRNADRFPAEFMFQLSKQEFEDWKSQSVTSNKETLISQSVTSKEMRGGHRKQPFVFTEAGVSMLSAVLNSETAIKMSVQIIRAFIDMRKFIANNAAIFQRLDSIEQKQYITDTRLDRVFEAIEAKDIKLEQGIFFDGQVFDAYAFVADLIKSAKQSIVLIDNYVDESTLILLSKRKPGCVATIYTHTFGQQLQLDLQTHNTQYPPITIKTFKQAHDRFLILDDHEVYHIGASLKDLGKKMFAFSRFEKGALELLGRLNE